MKTTPHTHAPKIEKRYSSLGDGYWVLNYGDQRVTIEQGIFCALRYNTINGKNWPFPKEQQIKKALEKAITMHDKGSIPNELIASLFSDLKERDGTWGKDILNANSTNNGLS